MIPAIATLPSLSQSASTSSSVALFRYLSTSTGFSGSTSTAVVIYRLRSLSERRSPWRDRRGRRGAHHHGITDVVGRDERLGFRARLRQESWRMSSSRIACHLSRSSAASMLSGGAEDLAVSVARSGGNRVILQRLLEPAGQGQRRLTAELHDDALRALSLDDVEHILNSERLKV